MKSTINRIEEDDNWLHIHGRTLFLADDHLRIELFTDVNYLHARNDREVSPQTSVENLMKSPL